MQISAFLANRRVSIENKKRCSKTSAVEDQKPSKSIDIYWSKFTSIKAETLVMVNLA